MSGNVLTKLGADVAAAWMSVQPPELLAAFRAACGCRPPMTCNHMTPEQRRLVDEWVERTWAQGYPAVHRIGVRGAIVMDEQGGAMTVGDVRPGDIGHPEKAPLRCDWPGCEFRTPEGRRQPKSSLGIHRVRAHGVRSASAVPVDTPEDKTRADSTKAAGQTVRAVSRELDTPTDRLPATFLGALAIPVSVEDLGRLFGDDAVIEVSGGVLTVSKVA